jgi:hypothetical protein
VLLLWTLNFTHLTLQHCSAFSCGDLVAILQPHNYLVCHTTFPVQPNNTGKHRALIRFGIGTYCPTLTLLDLLPLQDLSVRDTYRNGDTDTPPPWRQFSYILLPPSWNQS